VSFSRTSAWVAIATRIAADPPDESSLEEEESVDETSDDSSGEDEIGNTEATPEEIADAQRFIGQFQYTTTALTALSIALSEMEDPEGGQILLRAALEMARHEAKIV
jgi:hypothetical protein